MSRGTQQVYVYELVKRWVNPEEVSPEMANHGRIEAESVEQVAKIILERLHAPGVFGVLRGHRVAKTADDPGALTVYSRPYMLSNGPSGSKLTSASAVDVAKLVKLLNDGMA